MYLLLLLPTWLVLGPCHYCYAGCLGALYNFLMYLQEFVQMLEHLQHLQCRRIMILVATRQSVPAGFSMATSHHLSILDANSAEALLVALAGQSTEWRKDEAARLVSICGCNPLALRILAGFLKGKFCKPQVRRPCTCQCQFDSTVQLVLANTPPSGKHTYSFGVLGKCARVSPRCQPRVGLCMIAHLLLRPASVTLL